MDKIKNNSKKLKDIQFNFLMDETTKLAFKKIVEFSKLSASAIARRLILKEAKERTLEV